MDQILFNGENLQDASGQRAVAGDTDQEWGTSGVSDWAISILVVGQQPPGRHRCDSYAFRRRRQGGLALPTKRPFAEFPQQHLE